MRFLRVLNLGAGVQSTVVYLLACRDLIDPIQCAIFADTQEEPQAVYDHLEWLKSLNGPPIIVRTAGKLGDHLLHGVNSVGGRFASIPAYTAPDHKTRVHLTGCEEGHLRRQCTKEYKIEVVEKTIKRELLKLRYRERVKTGSVPKAIVTQLFGISCDEEQRAVRIRKRMEDVAWSRPEFPLLQLGWDRQKCKEWLKDKCPHEVHRSACVFCPYQSDSGWWI